MRAAVAQRTIYTTFIVWRPLGHLRRTQTGTDDNRRNGYWIHYIIARSDQDMHLTTTYCDYLAAKAFSISGFKLSGLVVLAHR